MSSDSAADDLAEAAMDAVATLDPLDQIEALAELGAMTQDRIVQAVRAARADQASWSQIGDALGVTKQSAFNKFRASVDGGNDSEEG
jgi:hypothetical protein